MWHVCLSANLQPVLLFLPLRNFRD
uniref:Uncharacterized protein n=1 Tax=Anguilla anguilla TaxID=7936 RepID=A0A0E9RB34_ANGAN